MSIPTIFVFLIFIITIPLLSALGLYSFKNVDTDKYTCPQNNNGMVGVYVGVSSVFLGVMISFLVVTSWNIYTQTQLNSQQEAQSIVILYQNVYSLPNTENIKFLILKYLNYVINVEYPELKSGNVKLFGANILGELQNAIYNYNPTGDRQVALYNNCVSELNNIIALRIERIHNGTSGLSPVVWGVCIFDSIIIVIITWLLICKNLVHYVLVIIISMFIAAGLFLIFILSRPFRGSSGLTPQPFREASTAIVQYSLTYDKL